MVRLQHSVNRRYWLLLRDILKHFDVKFDILYVALPGEAIAPDGAPRGLNYWQGDFIGTKHRSRIGSRALRARQASRLACGMQATSAPWTGHGRRGARG